MKLAVIAAMNEELDAIIKNIEVTKIDTLNHNDVYKYNGDEEIYFLTCGVGKVNAAVTTTLLIERYNITNIVSIGTAGGVLDNMEVTDLVVANKMAFHDVDVTPFGYLPGQLPAKEQYFTVTNYEKIEKIVKSLELKYHVGTIVTGDQFVNDSNVVAKINSDFNNVAAIEMESTAIVMAAHILEVDVVVLRSISDLANHESTMSFDAYLEVACKNFVNIVKKLIGEYYE